MRPIRPARPFWSVHPLRNLLVASATAWLTVALPANGAEPLNQASQTSQVDAALAAQVLDAANRYRASQRLPVLQPSTALAVLAAEHSGQMAQLRRLSHAGFRDRFERARRQTCVENLAAGFTRAEPMLVGWQQSADHHRNLLDARVQEVGVASVAGHVTWLACSAGTVH